MKTLIFGHEILRRDDYVFKQMQEQLASICAPFIT